MSSSDVTPDVSAHFSQQAPASVPGAEASSPQRFTLFAVFRTSSTHPEVLGGRNVTGAVRELEDVMRMIEHEHVTVRGWYDVSGMRSDADLMVWLHGSAAEHLQWALRELRRSSLLRPLVRVWGAVGVHREAEFNRAHIPGFMRGASPRQWLAVYPFARSHDWYLLDPMERSRLLTEHGRVGAAFSGVTTNIVAAFGLNDYEWLLPMEADELTELVDMMRALRSVEARQYAGVETPFFTGRRIEPVEIVEVIQ